MLRRYVLRLAKPDTNMTFGAVLGVTFRDSMGVPDEPIHDSDGLWLPNSMPPVSDNVIFAPLRIDVAVWLDPGVYWAAIVADVIAAPPADVREHAHLEFGDMGGWPLDATRPRAYSGDRPDLSAPDSAAADIDTGALTPAQVAPIIYVIGGVMRKEILDV